MPTLPNVHIVLADALAVLRALPEDSIDSIVTDPPYGLTSRFSVANSRFPGHRGKRRGFLGLAWDASLPDPEVWVEALRVLKPGGFLVAFGGPRTYHRLASAIEEAGFIIRDMLAWVQTQGMPKFLDLEREVRKLDPDRAEDWRGWQLNLKPAHEPVVLAQKPISENTFAANLLRWGVGGLHVDACRCPFLDEEDRQQFVRNFPGAADRYRLQGYESNIPGGSRPSAIGRHPANVVATDASALGPGGHVFGIDREAQTVLRCRKASQLERSHGGTVENNHPTVKPVRLVRWLIRLVTPKGGMVVDPFAGSGTTGLAALAEGCSAVLVERELEYVKIAEKRIAAFRSAGDHLAELAA